MLQFLRLYPVSAFLFAVAALWTLWGMIADVYDLWTAGLPSPVLAAAGAALFMLTTLSILYRWHSEHYAQSEAAGTWRWPWRRKIPTIDPRELFTQPQPREPLTQEQVLYRSELRRFATLIDSSARALDRAAQWLLPHPHADGPDDTAASALRFFYSSSISRFKDWIDDLARASRANVAFLDDRFEREIWTFLEEAYCTIQNNVRVYNRAVGLNLRDQSPVQEWLSKESACLEQLKTLKSFPAASRTVLGFSNDVFGQIGERWLREPREPAYRDQQG